MAKTDRRLKKAHIYTLWDMMPNIIPVLAVPIVQSLLFNPTNAAEFITSYGMNILILIIFLASIFMEYKSIEYLETQKRIRAMKGFFYKRSSDIPYHSIQSVYIKKNFRPRIFGARQFYIYTAGSFLKNGSYSLFLGNKNVSELNKNIFGEDETVFTYKGGALRTVIMIIAHSNTLTGLLVTAPVLYNISSQSTEFFKSSFNRTLDLVEFALSRVVPDTIAGMSALMIGGWLAAFAVNLVRYSFFRLEMGKKYLKTSRGIFNRVEFITPFSKINAIQIRQSILMQMMNLKSTYINAVGVKTQKGDMGLIIPADTQKHTNAVLDHITDIPKDENIGVRPVKTEFMSFLWLPLFCALGDLAAMFILHKLGYFGETVRFLLIVLLTVFLYWIFFRIKAYCKSSLNVCDKAVRIDYFDKLSFTRTFIPYERIQFINVYRSPFQRMYNTANVRIYVYSNKYSSYKIKNLRYDKVMQAVNIIEERI